MLSRNSLTLVLVTVVSVALVVLPILASDYPSSDRTEYLKILVSWPKKLNSLVDILRKDIQQDSITGRVHATQFIAKSTALSLYDVV